MFRFNYTFKLSKKGFKKIIVRCISYSRTDSLFSVKHLLLS